MNGGRVSRVALATLALVPAGVAAQDPVSDHRDACEGGELASCVVLGLIYETGAGGVRDVGRALGLYGRACARGVELGCERHELARAAPPDGSIADPFVRVGLVADAETGAPVDEALVLLPSLGVRALSDADGRVDLGRLPRGRHGLVVETVGYAGLRGELPVPWEVDFLILLERRADAPDPSTGRVFGRVTEAESGEGLAAVEVTILSEPISRVLSGVDGGFSLPGLEPGPVRVRFTRLGYEPREETVTVEAGQTVEVYLSMSTQPIELEPIVVTVGSSYLERQGFYRRARSARGRSFTRSQIEAAQPIQLSDLFWRVPNVVVQRTVRGARVVTRRPVPSADGSACYLRPYVDGAPVFDFDVDAVLPSDLAGLEVYQGLGAPIEYRNLIDPDGTRPCGVVLIWTRRR